MFFAWAHVFFFPFHKPNYYECAFFLAKPTTHARVVRHTILKRNGKKKPWAQTNNSLPNNHVRHNEASFNSTKWRCPYDNVTYCKFTPNRKQLPKQLPPPLHMARTWMDMHRLRRLHDSQYIMKNPFTNENSNLSNIFHNNIHRKKVESLKVRSTEEFLCQFAWLPCRFFRGRRQGRQPLNNYIYRCVCVITSVRTKYTHIFAPDIMQPGAWMRVVQLSLGWFKRLFPARMNLANSKPQFWLEDLTILNHCFKTAWFLHILTPRFSRSRESLGPGPHAPLAGQAGDGLCFSRIRLVLLASFGC